MFSFRNTACCFLFAATAIPTAVVRAEDARLGLCVLPAAPAAAVSHLDPLPARSPLHYRDDVYVINYFAAGKAEITRYSKAILERSAADLAQLLRINPAMIIEVAGYADAASDGAQARDLALRRAEMVRAFMVARGVPAERVVLARRDARAPANDKPIFKRRVETRVQKRPANSLNQSF